MDIFYLARFARQYKRLLLELKLEAEKKENIFRQNPFDIRLRTHKLHGPLAGYYGFSIDKRYRIIFSFLDDGNVIFHDIGSHDVYN